LKPSRSSPEVQAQFPYFVQIALSSTKTSSMSSWPWECSKSTKFSA
jgi:hypothetical protein